MYELPTSVELSTGTFNIRNKGDYRMVMDCFTALNDLELDQRERVFAALMIFYADIDSIEDLARLGDIEKAVKKMSLFFNCGQEEIGMQSNYKLLDWDKDSSLITSAINNVAHKEIRSESYVHWWTFMGYYLAIGECPLSTIVGIRHKIAKGKKLEKYEKDFKTENPQYFAIDYKSTEQKDLENWFKNEIWNK